MSSVENSLCGGDDSGGSGASESTGSLSDDMGGVKSLSTDDLGLDMKKGGGMRILRVVKRDAVQFTGFNKYSQTRRRVAAWFVLRNELTASAATQY